MKKILVIIMVLALSFYMYGCSRNEYTSRYAIIRLPDNTIVRGEVISLTMLRSYCYIELEKGATYITDYKNVVIMFE